MFFSKFLLFRKRSKFWERELVCKFSAAQGLVLTIQMSMFKPHLHENRILCKGAMLFLRTRTDIKKIITTVEAA
jgi:hypothetical protein